MSEPLDLEAIKKRAESATPGPWTSTGEGQIEAIGPEQYRGGGLGTYRPTIDIGGGNWGGEGGGYYMDAADADFIAHARTDVPALVAEVERLRTNNAELVALIQPILDRTEGQIGTHSSRCFEYHVACLADLVRERLT